MKKIILIFLVFVIACLKKNKDKEDITNWLLLYYLLNQPEPLEISCEDIPANSTSTNINTNPENCSNISDPLYQYQWHFQNASKDIQIGNTWQSYCGSNVKISVIDDGLELNHEDLSLNIESNKSYDYIENDMDPTGNPNIDDSLHGTAVAGLIAAKDNNKGVRGVSPRAWIRGYNAIRTSNVSDIIDATVRDIANIWISNNSWGIPDKTGYLINSDSLWKQAIETGLKNGRYGLGTIYVFAAGNGAYYTYNNQTYIADNSNYDGYANFYGVISICATGKDDKKANYSEEGSNLWICAPSMGNDGEGLVTTDLMGNYGFNSKYYSSGMDLLDKNYTKNFNGTSGSTPIVSGVVALILQANPYLSWRDVRYILAKSARKNDSLDSDWIVNGAGFSINHKYGFGVVHTENAVTMAKNWKNLGNYRKCMIKNIPVYSDIRDNIPIQNEFDASITSIKKIEWVDAIVHLNHSYWGDLSINLYSPSGTKAILMEPHHCSDGNGTRTGCQRGNMDWRFGIARYLDETAIGNFKMEMIDKIPDDQGYFKKWDLIIYGRTE